MTEPTDEEIMELAKPFITRVGSHWKNDNAIPDNGRAAMRIYIMKVRRQRLALCVGARLERGVLVTRCRVKGYNSLCSPVLKWSTQ